MWIYTEYCIMVQDTLMAIHIISIIVVKITLYTNTDNISLRIYYNAISNLHMDGGSIYTNQNNI